MQKRFNLQKIFLFTLSVAIYFINPALAQEEKEGPQVFNLGEVVVTEEAEAASLATTVSEVTEEDIKDWAVQTVGEALDLIPGVDLGTGGKGESHISMRGFAQSDLKLLIDGVPAYETFFGTLDLSALPVDSIAKITITKGASSVLYGANTMGGVVNIITKKGGKKPFTEFSTSFGDYNTQNYIFNQGAQLGKFNYWFTYSYRGSDGFRLSSDFDANNPYSGRGTAYNEDGGKRDLSDFIKRTIHTKVGYEPDENTSLYLSFDYHNNEKGCPTDSYRYWRSSQWDHWHLNLLGEKSFSDFFTIKLQGFYVNHDDELTDVSWDADHTTKKKWFEISKYNDYSVGENLSAYFDFGRLSFLKFGFSYIRDNHKQKEFLDKECVGVKKGKKKPGWQEEQEYEADTYTVALEDEINLKDKISLLLGLSYDYYNPRKSYDMPTPHSSDSVNPQGGIVYRLSDDTIFHASLGKKTRFPHLRELYSKLAGGNPALNPQKALTYEAGIKHSFNPFIKVWLTYFYNDMHDLIARVKRAGEWVYVNIGKGRTQGVEAGYDWAITKEVWAGMNYTFLSAREKEIDRELKGRPKHRLNFDLRCKLPYDFYVNLQASYTKRQIEYNDESRKYSDLFLFNTKVVKKLGKKWGIDSEIFVQIRNMTDKNYAGAEGRPMPGRNFLVGLTFRY